MAKNNGDGKPLRVVSSVDPNIVTWEEDRLFEFPMNGREASDKAMEQAQTYHELHDVLEAKKTENQADNKAIHDLNGELSGLADTVEPPRGQQPARLTKNELEELAHKQAKATHKLNKVMERKAERNTAHNKKIRDLNGRLKGLADEVENNVKHEPVRCTITIDYTHNTCNVRRHDLTSDHQDQPAERTLTTEEINNPELPLGTQQANEIGRATR